MKKHTVKKPKKEAKIKKPKVKQIPRIPKKDFQTHELYIKTHKLPVNVIKLEGDDNNQFYNTVWDEKYIGDDNGEAINDMVFLTEIMPEASLTKRNSTTRPADDYKRFIENNDNNVSCFPRACLLLDILDIGVKPERSKNINYYLEKSKTAPAQLFIARKYAKSAFKDSIISWDMGYLITQSLYAPFIELLWNLYGDGILNIDDPHKIMVPHSMAITSFTVKSLYLKLNKNSLHVETIKTTTNHSIRINDTECGEFDTIWMNLPYAILDYYYF